MNFMNTFREKSAVCISSILTYFTLFNISFAQTSTGCNLRSIQNLSGLVTTLISCFLTPISYLLVSLSIVIFALGVFKFIKAEGDGKQGGREFMFFGIIGIFVMVSLWGLVNILQNTFRI